MTSTWDELAFYGQLACSLFTRPRDLHKIPGPPGQWGLGHLSKIMRPDYHVQVLEWANKYGGVFKFSLGCQWVVVVSDPSIAVQVLGRGEGSVPKKCVGYHFFDLATNPMGHRSFFTTNDERQWMGVRKATASAFSMANVRRTFPCVLKYATTMADTVAALSPPPVSATQYNAFTDADVPGVDIQEHLELALLNVFVEGLFDTPADQFPGHDVAHAMNLVLEEANERLKVPLRGLATWLTRPRHYAGVRAAQQLLGRAYEQLADVVLSRAPPKEGDTSLWACLARVRHPATGAPLTKAQLVPEIGALLMAGFDTSSHTIAWVLYALATHPHIQQHVQEELARAGLLQAPGVYSRPLVLDDLSRLPYLNCVVDEVMRLYPVAATASVRELTTATRVGPYTVPAGVIVWPMVYALHNATHNWAAPEEFRPDRWYDRHYTGTSSTPPPPAPSASAAPATATCAAARNPAAAAPAGPDAPCCGAPLVHASNGREGSAVRKAEGSKADGVGGAASAPLGQDACTTGQGGAAKPGRAFMPFSDGIKSCLGQNLGLMEVRTVLAVLCSRFTFTLHPSMGGAEQVKRSMTMSLTLKIKGGLQVVCTPVQAPGGRLGGLCAAPPRVAMQQGEAGEDSEEGEGRALRGVMLDGVPADELVAALAQGMDVQTAGAAQSDTDVAGTLQLAQQLHARQASLKKHAAGGLKGDGAAAGDGEVEGVQGGDDSPGADAGWAWGWLSTMKRHVVRGSGTTTPGTASTGSGGGGEGGVKARWSGDGEEPEVDLQLS